MKRDISLADGGKMEIECTELFYDKIREHFKLLSDEVPSDEHVVSFIYGACKTAVDKAEQELKQDGRWKQD